MGSARRRKLKVFQAQFGFHNSVVAASSQAEALRAWGVHQNLFAEGQAKLAIDEAAIKAALAHPGAPLRRAVGSTGAFALEPTDLPAVPDAPENPRRAKGAERAPAKAKAAPKPPADRSGLDAAEAVLRKLDEQRKRQEAALREKQAALDDEIAEAQSSHVRARKAAGAAIAKARTAYRQAGGED